jgi:ribosomal protein S18 acetylase RimI-like enzyme
VKKKEEPQFVRASFADLETVLAFVKKYYEFDGIRFNAPELGRSLELLLRDPSFGRVWLIRVARKEVGYVILTFSYDIEFGGRQGTVTDLYFMEEYRRLGLGSKTFNFLELACRELDIKALELQVERKNVAAQAFYRKLGFQPGLPTPRSHPVEQAIEFASQLTDFSAFALK